MEWAEWDERPLACEFTRQVERMVCAFNAEDAESGVAEENRKNSPLEFLQLRSQRTLRPPR